MILAMRNLSNLTSTRIIVDSNNFRYNAIANAGIDNPDTTDDKFDTPIYFDESNANAANKPMATDINTHVNPYTNVPKPGSTDDEGQIDGDISTYRNLVASMRNKEHAIDFSNNTNN